MAINNNNTAFPTPTRSSSSSSSSGSAAAAMVTAFVVVWVLVISLFPTLVHALPLTAATQEETEARSALLSLKTHGEKVLRADQLPENMREVVEGLQKGLARVRARSDLTESGSGAGVADGATWSGDIDGNDGGLDLAMSPELLSFLTSSSIKEKDVSSASLSLQLV